MDYLKNLVLTPDETKVVYLVTEGDDGVPPGNNGTLRKINLTSGTETDITLPDETVTAWGVPSDSSTVAYAGMSRSGGDPYLALADLSTGVIERKEGVPDELLNGFFWSGPKNLAFLGASPDAPEDESPHPVVVMDENPDPVILTLFAIDTGKVTAITKNTDVIYEYKPSPDGKYIIYKSSVYPESRLDNPVFTYYLLNVVNGTEDEIMSRVEGYQDENECAWAPDSSYVYIERMHNGGIHYPVRYLTAIVVLNPITKNLEEIPLQCERGIHQDIFNNDVGITPFNGGAYALLSNGTNPVLARFDRNDSGWEMSIL
jgi:WD40 repeat protein